MILVADREKSMTPAHDSIDWQVIRGRIDDAARRLDREAAHDAGSATAILRARAEALARKPDFSEAESAHLELLEFRMGTERWGAELSLVREVEFLEKMAPIPCTPWFVLGVIQLRGRIVAVNDLRLMLHLPVDAEARKPKVVLLGDEQRELAIVADAVIGTSTVPRERLGPAPATSGKAKMRYVLGVAPGPVAILDGRKLLEEPSMRINETVAAGR